MPLEATQNVANRKRKTIIKTCSQSDAHYKDTFYFKHCT